MLAAVYHGPRDLRLEERPTPAIGPDEALLRVVGCGICGTDLRIHAGAHRKYPAGTVRVPGHEITGELAAVGAAVRGLAVGQRVFVAPNFGCGHCRQCVAGNNNLCPDTQAFGITLDGGFAEYLRIPAAAILQGNIIPLAAGANPAAAVIEPFACVLRGQEALDPKPDDAMLVIGAGPIGLLHVLLARLLGVGRILAADRHPERLARAAEAGADVIVDIGTEDLAEAVAEHTGGRGADIVVVAAPSAEAMVEAAALAATGGRINLFAGLPKDRPVIALDANLVHYKELRVTGTTACSTRDCRRAAAIVDSGRLDLGRIVDARYPLRAAVEAVAAMGERRALKVVLEP